MTESVFIAMIAAGFYLSNVCEPADPAVHPPEWDYVCFAGIQPVPERPTRG